MSDVRRVVSNVLAVAYREARVLRHDAAFLATVGAQPIMMLLLFGFALSNEPANVPWTVLDRSDTTVSRRLVETIGATGYFLAPERVTGYDEGLRRTREGRGLVLLVIPRSFARDVERGRPRVQLLLDGSDPLSSARIGAYVAEVAGAFDPRGAPPVVRTRVGPPGPVAAHLDLRQRFWFNATLDDSKFFLTALAGMLLTNLCLSITALGLVGERESGTYEQTLALPITPTEIVLGKLVPLVVMSYVILILAILETGLIFGYWPAGSLPALALVTLPFVLASLAIGVFVSAVVNTSAQAVFITVFFILPSFVLSGVMFPYQLMPDGIRELGGMLPLRWYQIALRDVVSRGGGLVEVLGPLATLTAQFGVLLGLVRWRLKPRLG